MKGLLLKEWYLMKKYCWTYLLITVIFLAISCVNKNLFFLFYPCLLCGMIPINLLSLDERSGWARYSGTLPYTKAQIVSAKYLVSLFSMIGVPMAACIVRLIQMSLAGAFRWGELFTVLFAMILVSEVFASFCLPLIFRFGTEKGRIIYSVMVGLLCAVLSVVARLLLLWENFQKIEIELNILLVGLALVGTGLYVLSWFLSIWFYKKREV